MLKKKVSAANDLHCNLLLGFAVPRQYHFTERPLALRTATRLHLSDTGLDIVLPVQAFVHVIVVVCGV